MTQYDSDIKIETLIERCCPDGVKYVNLGQVVTFSDGFAFSSNNFSDAGEYPVVKITDIYNGVINKGKTFIETFPDKLKKTQVLSGGEVLVAMSGSTGKTGYNSLNNAVVNQRIAILRNNSNVMDNGFM